MPFASEGTVWPFGIGAGPRAVQEPPEVVVVKSRGVAATLRGRCVARTGAVAVDASALASRSLFSGLTTLAVGFRGFCAMVVIGAASSTATMVASNPVRSTRELVLMGEIDLM